MFVQVLIMLVLMSLAFWISFSRTVAKIDEGISDVL